MNLSRFFIDRPIFAGVISFAIFLAGLISMFQLPISEYPEVVPPTVLVSAQFPGANPKVISETVATPLEEQIAGTEGMLYMYSQASGDGILTLTVTFKLGTDPNLDQQLVQNRVNQALPRLPQVTQQIGVTTTKSSPDLTMVVHLISPDNSRDMLYLRNYATLNVKDQLAKIQGVGQVSLFGSGDYAMRIWLDPNKVAELGLTADDVVNAVKAQNVQAAAGIIGGPPYGDGVQLQLPVNAQGRLTDVDQFGDIIIKHNVNGVVSKLKDVSRIEIEADQYGLRSLLNNQQAVAIPIFQSPGSNAIQISDSVRATMAELKRTCPTASTTPSSTTRPCSCAARFAPWCTRSSRPWPWSCSSSSSSCKRGVPRSSRCSPCPCRLSAPSRSCISSASPLMRSRSSAWCSPSASWSTTPSSWSRTSSATSRGDSRPMMRQCRRCAR